MRSLSVLALAFVGKVLAQNATTPISTAISTVGSATVASVAPSAIVTSLGLSVDDLWDLFVGPVSNYSINTTVAATPVPASSLIPPPPLYYAPFPTGQQNPATPKNASWSFPKNFWWGVASAAFQVEGAVKDEGRGPSVWDVFTHRVTNFIVGNDTGDIADNHYYLYKQDIARIAALGVPYYSFSLSWSRILPFGRGEVNEQALRHYDDVIATCLEYNVKPLITLYHWDLPLWLQNLYGGWLDESYENIVDDFVNYANIVFSRWGNQIEHWFTFNEPSVFCNEYPYPEHYFRTTNVPPKQQPYVCGQNVLLAHGKSYRLAKSLGVKGTVSFKNNGGHKIPLTDSPEDALATQRAWDFSEGQWANPVYINGDYAQNLKDYTSTFLPDFTEEQKASINGSADLFAHDAYAASFYYAPDDGIDACVANSSNPLWPGCFNSTNQYATGWNIGPAADPKAPWLHKTSDWLPNFLHYIQDTWKPRGGVAVTEFGFGEPFEQLKTTLSDILLDPIRSSYYTDYMEGILIAMSEGVEVVGALAWSIFDNLEWAQGYNVKFGMQYVNLTTQERYYKASFFEFVNVFKVYQVGSNLTIAR
ncbi:MAG: hypothetical protein M1820_005362 [Bogoriella megaspora]|nr:MAG: hypothetical protein M1820_005362 [Bogoriella megaspora]